MTSMDREHEAPKPSITDLALFCEICRGFGLTENTGDDDILAGQSLRHLSALKKRPVSTLSLCIKRLEKLWKEELIVPTEHKGKSTVTAAGRQYFKLASDVVELHRRLQQPLALRPSVVTIGAYSSLLASHLPQAIGPLFKSKAEHPRIRFREQTFEGLVRAVEAGEVDFGVGAVPLERDARAAAQRVEIRGLQYKVERGFICHPDHPLATKAGVTKYDLAKEVMFRLPSSGGIPSLDDWLPTRELVGGEIVEVTNFGIALECVKRNLGVAIVPYLPGEIQDSVELNRVYYQALPDLGLAEVATYLPVRGEGFLSPAALTVLNQVEEYFRSNAKATPLRPPSRRRSK